MRTYGGSRANYPLMPLRYYTWEAYSRSIDFSYSSRWLDQSRRRQPLTRGTSHLVHDSVSAMRTALPEEAESARTDGGKPHLQAGLRQQGENSTITLA